MLNLVKYENPRNGEFYGDAPGYAVTIVEVHTMYKVAVANLRAPSDSAIRWCVTDSLYDAMDWAEEQILDQELEK